MSIIEYLYIRPLVTNFDNFTFKFHLSWNLVGRVLEFGCIESLGPCASMEHTDGKGSVVAE